MRQQYACQGSCYLFFFSSRRRHTRLQGDWSSDVCSSDLKMRAAFGKVNTLHNHVLPWTDRPLVITNLVGGEDGIDDAGISVARLINNPWIFLEATGQVFRGDSGEDLFHSSKRGDLSYVGHLRAYQDITESSNIDLGFSYSQGHNRAGIIADVDVGRFVTKLYG